MTSWPRRALHLFLFLATACTTSLTGLQLSRAFARGQAFRELDLALYGDVWQTPWLLWQGLPFSGPLLLILLAHEFGHYVACRYYKVQATLPYFLPAPTLIGTLGAFIRIPEPILRRRALFDIAVAGPLAGMLVLLPVFAAGLAWSRVVSGTALRADWQFGVPALFQAGHWWLFPSASAGDILWHPTAYAAWVGLFATGLNLLPVGQLDGGHLLYAVTSRWHRTLSIAFLTLLAGLGFVTGYWQWYVWVAVLALFGLRHPLIHDRTPLGRNRLLLALLAAAVFALCFMPVPLLPGVRG